MTVPTGVRLGLGPASANLSSTDDLAEGSTNLYYTNARADARVTAATVGHHWWPAQYVSGQYYFPQSQHTSSTSSTLTNGTVRVAPWVVVSDVTITRLFVEFTVAGDANSVFRVGIWNHSPSTGKPSTLVLDAGTISTGTGNAGDVATGGVAGVYELTVSQALTAGAYFIGGVVQGVSSTQPTMRTMNLLSHPLSPLGSSLPASGINLRGHSRTSITDSFDQYTWSTSTTWNTSGNDPARIGFKVA